MSSNDTESFEETDTSNSVVSTENLNGDRASHSEGAERRSTRSAPLSLKARENKAIQLSLQLTTAINSQLSVFDSQVQSLSNSVDVSSYQALLGNITSGFNDVCVLFEQLVQVSEDNKVNAQTQTIFDDYSAEINSLKDSTQQKIDEIIEGDEEERELERQMEETRKQLEEQTKLYNDSKMRRGSRRPSTHHHEEVQPTLSSISNNTDHRNSQTQPTRADSSTTEGLSAIQQLVTAVASSAETLAASVEKAAAKRSAVEPAMFSGDVIEFIDWEIDLDAYLEAEDIKVKDRLRHLKKYVSGEALRCIQGHFHTNTVDAYRRARETLTERFGDKREITKSFRKKMADWPSVKDKDGRSLRDFGDFLSHVSAAMKSLPGLKVINDEQENQKLCEKLPEWLRTRWFRVVDHTEETHYRYPTLSEFVNFISKEARILIRQNEQSSVTPKPTPQRTSRTLNTSTDTEPSGCSYCSGNHTINNCFTLENKPMADRVKYVHENRLCFGCLRKGHHSKQCQSRSNCRRCNKRHPTSLHDKNWKRESPPRNESPTVTANSESPQSEVTTTAANVNSTSVKRKMYSMTVPIYVSSGKGEKLVYALLDTQSDASFITQDVAEDIGAHGEAQDLMISTINGETAVSTKRYTNLKIRGYLTDNETRLDAYQQPSIKCDSEQIPIDSACKDYPHLKTVAKELSPYLDIPVGLLIGADCAEALIQYSIIPGRKGEPFAAKTMFGWTLCGGKRSDKLPTHSFRSRVEISKDTEILKSLEREFQDVSDGKISQEDLKFLADLESGTFQQENGSYVLPLPLREKTHLPDNRAQAEKRFEQLKKRLRTDEQYKQEYFSFMDDLITNGHAEKVPENSTPETGSVWYIPHFAVRHPRKKKLRVVFDASAKFNNICLNDMLLCGPDHMNSLTGILCRFRKEHVAVCCDIERMFYNFQVPAEYRDYLRFLWTDQDMTETKEYRMAVHLFGATSSPAVATFGLRKLATDHSGIAPKAAAFLHEDFYVDDGITSVDTQEAAIELIKGAREICAKGKVRLHKFISNDKVVLNSIPETERNENINNSELFNEKLPTESTLGLKWNAESDCFKFVNNVKTKPATKRGLLSTVGQVYDPLGFVAPFILKGKQILQKCTASNSGWDEPISDDLSAEWLDWVKELDGLESISIPRCLKPTYLADIVKVEIHHFSDASLSGYGACSYLRLVDSNGLVHCALLLAKSRVAPLHPVTIPRLELQAAVVATRLSTMLKAQLKLKIDDEFFWSDSTIVLGYIANETKRFHMYVANRIYTIKQASETAQWHHIPTKDNPADVISRGCTLPELKDSTFLNGPHFLQETNITDYIRRNEVKRTITEEDPEVRVTRALATTTAPSTELTTLFKKFSSWESLVRSLAILKQQAKNKCWKVKPSTPEDLKNAEKFIMRACQTKIYQEEMETLRQKSAVNRSSTIVKLNPYVDKDGILRVGGRLKSTSKLNQLEKHPAIIPKDSHIAKIIIRHQHARIHHLGQRSTLAAIRESGVWIVHGTRMVKATIANCVTCARLRRPPEKQQMGNLPPERLEETPPFTHVGMDVFGPFTIKDRRTEYKRWGLLFTCLYSRAIHIEMLEDMSSDAFLNALRCLVSIRGPVRTLFSDQGTNFVGARNELKRLTDSVTEPGMKEYLQLNRIEFKMNSPDASHQGGVWERLIRSVRTVLDGMAIKFRGRMDTQTLRTAFYEAMSLVNSRPITSMNINDPQETVITPNHLLTMKDSVPSAPPPRRFEDDEAYSRLRWRKAQCFAEVFWRTWKSDYLSQLTQRRKWAGAHKNVKVGDLVIVVDQETQRGKWKLGVIQEATKGNDKLVRKVTVRMANRQLNHKGEPYTAATILERPVQKVVVVMRA